MDGYIVSYPETLRAFLLEAHNKFKLFKSFVSSYVWCKINTAFYKKIMPTVKQDGVSVMVRGCFIASGLGWLTIIDETMNSALFQKILMENV